MAYRVELTIRAARDLRHIYSSIDAQVSLQAKTWFSRLEQAIFSLNEYPARGAIVPEDDRLRQILHGRKPYVYRIIYAIDESRRIVTILHIRHGARDAFTESRGSNNRPKSS